jgi:hypothetical protein
MVVSVEVGGPHESPDGRADKTSASDIGAMIARRYVVSYFEGQSKDLCSRIFVRGASCGL